MVVMSSKPPTPLCLLCWPPWGSLHTTLVLVSCGQCSGLCSLPPSRLSSVSFCRGDWLHAANCLAGEGEASPIQYWLVLCWPDPLFPYPPSHGSSFAICYQAWGSRMLSFLRRWDSTFKKHLPVRLAFFFSCSGDTKLCRLFLCCHISLWSFLSVSQSQSCTVVSRW